MIWICQCLCGPKRHCILALAFDSAKEQPDVMTVSLEAVVMKAIALRQINPWCGVCGSRASEWAVESAATRYTTMEEALPHLKQLEAEQMAARDVIGQAGRN